jgi:hypothetical protein
MLLQRPELGRGVSAICRNEHLTEHIMQPAWFTEYRRVEIFLRGVCNVKHPDEDPQAGERRSVNLELGSALIVIIWGSMQHPARPSMGIRLESLLSFFHDMLSSCFERHPDMTMLPTTQYTRGSF